MMNSEPTLLLADIGGTHARFAIWRAGRFLREPAQWMASVHPDLPTALDSYLKKVFEGDVKIDGVSVCGAGPVVGGNIQLTNSPWAVNASEIAAVTGVATPVIVNDFTAMAMGVTHVDTEHQMLLGPEGEPVKGAAIGVIGPGTGLGVSGLIPDARGNYWPISGEGGHVDLAPSEPREMALVQHLLQRDGHISAETVLSGPGLEAVYDALAEMYGRPLTESVVAADISVLARDRTDPLAIETVRLFTRWLGAVSGDLALSLGAQGGVYLTGGILPKWGNLFDAALFREGFEGKGKMSHYVRKIPTTLIVGGRPAMLGLAEIWRQTCG